MHQHQQLQKIEEWMEIFTYLLWLKNMLKYHWITGSIFEQRENLGLSFWICQKLKLKKNFQIVNSIFSFCFLTATKKFDNYHSVIIIPKTERNFLNICDRKIIKKLFLGEFSDRMLVLIVAQDSTSYFSIIVRCLCWKVLIN